MEHVIKYEDSSVESPLFALSDKDEVEYWEFLCGEIDELRVIDKGAEEASSIKDIPTLNHEGDYELVYEYPNEDTRIINLRRISKDEKEFWKDIASECTNLRVQEYPNIDYQSRYGVDN